MTQKITLNRNNKLVIFTDNGKIDGDNNQSTEIKGTFEIEAENVAILGALLNDMSIARKEVFFKGDWIFTYNIITKDDKIKSLIKRVEDGNVEIKRLEDECKRLESICRGLEELYHKCCHEYNSLKAKVEEHNAKPFSRKIKLD